MGKIQKGEDKKNGFDDSNHGIANFYNCIESKI